MNRPRLFLDACVLYPPLTRALLTGAAEAGLFVPLWSARVLDEWSIAVARKDPAALAGAEAARSALTTRFPTATVAPCPETDLRLALPDPSDAHVAAAAAAAEADAVVTFNLRDFPARALAPFGLAVRHPDGLLWELWSKSPSEIEAVLTGALPGQDPSERRRALKRARLSRFGKAQEVGIDG